MRPMTITFKNYLLITLKMAKNELDAINNKRGITTPAQDQINEAIKILESEDL